MVLRFAQSVPVVIEEHLRAHASILARSAHLPLTHLRLIKLVIAQTSCRLVGASA